MIEFLKMIILISPITFIFGLLIGSITTLTLIILFDKEKREQTNENN